MDLDERIDEILKRLCTDYITNYNSLDNDFALQTQATDHNKSAAKQAIKQLIEKETELRVVYSFEAGYETGRDNYKLKELENK